MVYKAGPAERAAAFVGHEQPLASLEAHLETALLGQGRLAFITGSAGEGKTSLLVEFARRAQRYTRIWQLSPEAAALLLE